MSAEDDVVDSVDTADSLLPPRPVLNPTSSEDLDAQLSGSRPDTWFASGPVSPKECLPLRWNLRLAAVKERHWNCLLDRAAIGT